MNRPLRNVSRFSAKAVRRRRMLCFAMVFIAVALLALGSALVLAFDESAPPPTYDVEFSQEDSTQGFSNAFHKSGCKEKHCAVHYFRLDTGQTHREKAI
jgi:hypothetical protein